MGNNKSDDNHKKFAFIYSDWLYISRFNQFDVYKNAKTNQQVEVYTLNNISQQDITIYEWRKFNKNKNVPQVLHFEIIQGSNKYLCNSRVIIKIILERTPLTLYQVLKKQKIQQHTIIKECLQGFQFLFKKFGTFKINSDMIRFTKELISKVWINYNFGINRGNDIQRMTEQSEEKMVQNLLILLEKIIENRIIFQKKLLKFTDALEYLSTKQKVYQKCNPTTSNFKQKNQSLNQWITTQSETNINKKLSNTSAIITHIHPPPFVNKPSQSFQTEKTENRLFNRFSNYGLNNNQIIKNKANSFFQVTPIKIEENNIPRKKINTFNPFTTQINHKQYIPNDQKISFTMNQNLRVSEFQKQTIEQNHHLRLQQINKTQTKSIPILQKLDLNFLQKRYEPTSPLSNNQYGMNPIKKQKIFNNIIIQNNNIFSERTSQNNQLKNLHPNTETLMQPFSTNQLNNTKSNKLIIKKQISSKQQKRSKSKNLYKGNAKKLEIDLCKKKYNTETSNFDDKRETLTKVKEILITQRIKRAQRQQKIKNIQRYHNTQEQMKSHFEDKIQKVNKNYTKEQNNKSNHQNINDQQQLDLVLVNVQGESKKLIKNEHNHKTNDKKVIFKQDTDPKDTKINKNIQEKIKQKKNSFAILKQQAAHVLGI